MEANMTDLPLSRKVTCLIRYVVNRDKVDDFEEYGKMWIRLVNRLGGTHHGYLLPYEGADNIAYALFTFPSLASYEEYRMTIRVDKDCQEAFALAKSSGCILNSERTFLRPVFE